MLSFTGTRSSQGRPSWSGESFSDCAHLSVRAGLHALYCMHHPVPLKVFFPLRMALLVNDQKQFVLRMITRPLLQLWLAATRVTASPPELPDAGRLASLSVQAREFLEIGLIHTSAVPTQRADLTRVASCCDPLRSNFLLRRFQFGLSGVELRLIGLTLAKASWGHRCSWSTLGNASSSPVPFDHYSTARDTHSLNIRSGLTLHLDVAVKACADPSSLTVPKETLSPITSSAVGGFYHKPTGTDRLAS